MNKKFSWSYSRYELHRQCPRKYKFKSIDKIPEPLSEHFERGRLVHTLAEDYLNGKIKNVPSELALLSENFEELKAAKPWNEKKIALNRSWKSTGYFDKDVWLRSIADSMRMLDPRSLLVIDFKTGKIRDNYVDQLELMALVAFQLYDIEKVYGELWYIDSGDIKTLADINSEVPYYTIDDAPRLKEKWEANAHKIEIDDVFAPNPTFLCGWCAYSQDEGGQCEH